MDNSLGVGRDMAIYIEGYQVNEGTHRRDGRPAGYGTGRHAVGFFTFG